jgi:hypothetical protein
MNKTAFLNGYMYKEANPTIQELLDRSKDQRSLFFNGNTDSGRMEALAEAAGDTSVNTNHPVASDMVSGLTGSIGGVALGGYLSKNMSNSKRAVIAGISGGVGGLAALLLARKLRRSKVERLAAEGATADIKELTPELKRISDTGGIKSALKSIIMPGARWADSGYTEVAEAITDPDKKFKNLTGETARTGLQTAGQLVSLAGALTAKPELALAGLGTRLGADAVGLGSSLLEQSDNKRKAGKVLDTINRMQGRQKE